jgi:hypothetical protein
MHATIEYALHTGPPASPHEWDRTVSVTEFLRFPPGNTTGEAPVLFYVPVRESNATQPGGTWTPEGPTRASSWRPTARLDSHVKLLAVSYQEGVL